ncbi:MAG: lysostaphin resistance A-like protein [Planctomycetota bacterium]
MQTYVPGEPLSAEQLVLQAQVGVVLVAAAVTLAPLTALAVRRIFPGRNIVFARWGFSHVVAAVALIFASLIVLQSVWPQPPGDVTTALLRMVCVLAVAGVYVLRVAHRMEPEGWRALGLWRGRQGRAVVAGVVAYGMSLPLLLGLLALWPWVLERLGGQAVEQETVRLFAELSPGERWLPAILAIAVQPFFEELLFRVFLQPLLVQNLSDKLGVIATSLAFASLHGFAAFLPIFGLSLVLGGVMLRTQRLAAVWAVHALHNGLTVWLTFAAVDGGAQATHGLLW